VDGQREAWNDFYRSNRRPWRGNSGLVHPFGKGDRVLEIGCGNGKTVSSLLDDGVDVVGLDFSETAIEQCRELFETEFVCSPCTELPFDDRSFDGVIAFHVLEHLQPDELKKTMAEIGRVLKNDGTLLVKVFSKDDMRSGNATKGNGIFYHYFDRDELSECLKGFQYEIEEKNDATRFGTVRSRLVAIARKRFYSFFFSRSSISSFSRSLFLLSPLKVLSLNSVLWSW